MSLPRNYEDLTVSERDNVIKKQLIDFARKKANQKEIEVDQEEFVENADLESKKRKLIDTIDPYLVLLTQTLDYFAVLPGQGGANVLKFVKEDRVARFFDNYARINVMSNQIIDLLNSIFKEISANDPIYKKLKKKYEKIKGILHDYENLFNPRIDAVGDKKTNFRDGGMKGFSPDEVHQRVYDIIDNLEIISKKMGDMVEFFESTPRSGKGVRFNIDTTEYIIPSKYL
jgi:hypothetical protein